MRIGSLYSGIGGLDWACEAAFGGETVWQLDQVNAAVRGSKVTGQANVGQRTLELADLHPRPLGACGGRP